MRRRDPRRLIARHARLPARVRLVEEPESEQRGAGEAVTSRQSALVTLPTRELERIWSPEYLERLARTYWRFLTRSSRGLLKVLYTDTGREIVLLRRPFILLKFHRPDYRIDRTGGAVTWRIDHGLLVAPSGRGSGYLRIAVERQDAADDEPEEVTVKVTAEVANFYPMLGGWGWWARFGRLIYSGTQLRIHVIVTRAFLRSLGRLDLAPSAVGSLRAPPEPVSPRARE